MRLLLFFLLIAAILVLIARFVPKGKTISLYAVLIVIAVVMLLPFYMMFIMSTHSTAEIFSFPPYVTFGDKLVQNFQSMNEAVNFLRSFRNSCIVTFGNVALVLFFCSIGGYAFSVYNFPGREPLFAILLATMMIPSTAGIIPWYIMMSKFSWVNTFRALIIPNCANAFGIYWFRQYCKNNADRGGTAGWLLRVDHLLPCDRTDSASRICVTGNYAVCQCVERLYAADDDPQESQRTDTSSDAALYGQ